MKKYFILTFGCQMSVYDSNLMATLLENDGYTSAYSIEQADVIIVNTCAVRNHAVNRVLSRIDSLKLLKKKKPHLRIGVTGCVPQHLKEKLYELLPFLDFALGPDNLKRITSCAQDENGLFIEPSKTSTYSDISPARGSFPEAFVSVMRGCNNFCSYCVVPYTRGFERSRKADDILTEIDKLSKLGYKRVVLLGQNVNNFSNEGVGLPHLLTEVAKIEGIERIGFLTSHPAYFPLKVLDIMKKNLKIEKHLHLPLQSGSTRILKLMKRGYTIEQYLEIVDHIRDKIKDIALSTDIIVGFPDEEEKDFTKTIEIVNKIGFDFAYMFKYSPRKFTLAHTFNDNISEEIKIKRLNKLISTQSEITRKKSNALKGSIHDILITGENEKNCLESNGITLYNKRVVVKGKFSVGNVITVKLEEVKGWTPIGVPLNPVRISHGPF